ncbi:MAG: sulfatase-like hydrolase/transferase [Lacunisphaera sp.]|nr:sulfatase-like hydrolase/transferase [Lacunisphaera sp.]
MKKYQTLLLAGLLTVAGSARAESSAIPKPNIIFILGDDVGIGDVACSGADRYKTPHIDALAKGGINFTHAYAEPLCGPSRATILTGRYVFRTGSTNQDSTGRFRPKDETMMPVVLKQAGYVTASIGKWGQLPLGPADFGFDDYLKFQGSGIYWNTQEKGKSYELNGKTMPLRDKEYMPDVMHAHLVDFITKHHDDPFYIYYSMSHIHGEILPTPDTTPGGKDDYADNISYMDKLVGKLVAELERQHLREKTLIIYFGDNGTANGYAPTSTVGGRRLLGAKGSMFEGGSRVPFVLNWPGIVAPGQVSNQLIDSSDFFSTFAELAGAKLPAGKVIDGHSFAPQLRGGKGTPREWIFIELARKWYAADLHFKLTEKGELFDLSGAPWAETLVPVETKDPAALAARTKLQGAIDQLNPAGGFLDDGDGTGRHAGNSEKRAKKKNP